MRCVFGFSKNHGENALEARIMDLMWIQTHSKSGNYIL